MLTSHLRDVNESVKAPTRATRWARKRRAVWKATGRCPVCGKAKAEGRSKCPTCLATAATWKRRKTPGKPKSKSRAVVTVAPQYLRDLASLLYDQHGADPKLSAVASALAEAAESIRRLTR